MSQCANVFKHHQVMETTVLEKLSIILQRLSKNRCIHMLNSMYYVGARFFSPELTDTCLLCSISLVYLRTCCAAE